MKTTLTTVSIMALAGTIGLSGCAGTGTTVDKGQVGTLTGAVVGGVVGNQIGGGSGKTIATIAGAVLGGYLGGRIGSRMDNYDRRQVGSALQSNRPVSWTNPNNGNRYNAKPGRPYQSQYQGHNTECKDVFIDGYIDGQYQQIKTKACRSGSNTWEIVR